MGSDETKGKRPSEVDDEEEDPPEEPASPATPQPDVVAPVIEALKPVVSRFNYAARAFEQLLGTAAEKHDQPEPTDKPTGPAKPGTAPADANAAANAAALKKLDDSFETSLRTRTEAFENLKVSDQPGSAAETSLLDIEWQKQVIETLGRFGKEQSKLDLTVKPVDLQAVQEKIKAGKVGELTRDELTAAIKQEALDGQFGPASKHGLKLTVDWHNQVILDTYKDLISSGMRLRAGGPIPSFTGQSDVKTEFGTSLEAYKAKILSDKTDVAEIQRMVKAGELKTDLFFETEKRPTRDQLRGFSDANYWLNESQARLAENNHKLEANRRWRVINEILGIKDTGWAPPENPAELMRYCQRADDVSNLMFRMRNNAEAINSLKQIDGDFKTEALEKFPGKITWSGNPPKIETMKLDLPDSLAVTPENERKLQKLRDWLDTYGPGVERALEEYRTGNFARYGDFVEKGKVGKDGDKTVKVTEEGGSTRAVILQAGTEIEVRGPEGPQKIKLDKDTNFHRNLDGTFRYEGKLVLSDLKPNVTSEAKFDYICDKFSVKHDEATGEIVVNMDRSLEADHGLNYKRWFGIQVGTMGGERRYKPDDLVAIQTSSGKLQLIRADRLQEFLNVQAIMHHGGKIVDTALDVGMFIGFAQASAAIRLGKMFYAGVGIVRGMLGVGGLLDPMFRQMGETGETIRQARHYAILLDVTQGLLRKGVGALRGGKMLFETEAAAAVSRAMEQSKWISRANSASTKVFGVCDAYYLPVMSHDIYEKGRERMGYDPRARLEEARKAIGDGRGDSTDVKAAPRDPKAQAEAIAKVLSAYEATLSIKDPALKQKVAERFESIRKGLADGKLGADTRDKDLTRFFLPSETQLLDLKSNNPKHMLPRNLEGKLELTGTEDEKVAAALGLIYLSLKDGKLPEDGVLARRHDKIPEFTYEIPSGGDGPPTVITVPEQPITQEVKLKEMLSILQQAALNGERPETRMVAADALFRLGATNMTSGQYASLALEYLEKERTTDANKDFRVKMMRQVSDLIELSRFEETNETAPNGNQYGAGAEALHRRLQEVAATEKDPDARAMAMAILHARNFNEKDMTPEQVQAKHQESLDQLFKKFEELKGKPGAFHEFVLDGFKKELNTELPKGPKEAVEAAIDKRLRAVQAFRNFEGSPLEAETFKAIDINKKLDECLAATKTDQLHMEGPNRLSLPLTMRIIDAMMARKDTLTEEQSKNVARTAIGIMKIPYPQDGVGRTEPAIAKLAVMARMNQIFEGKPNQQKLMVESLRDILDPESSYGPKNGWGQFPEMRAAAINMIAQLGTTDVTILNLIADRLKYDPTARGTDAFTTEPIPQVRAAAINALAKLAEHRFHYKESEIKELEKKDPNVRKTLGLDPALKVEELLKRERDPAALDSLWRIWERGNRLDPQSVEYKHLFDQACERLDSASMITFTKADALAFVNSRPTLAILDPSVMEGEVKRRSEDLRVDPYAGFLGWCDRAISSNKTIRQYSEAATADATATAYTEKRKDRETAFTELANFTNMSPEEQQNAIKTLMHIIRHPDGSIFEKSATDSQRELARIRASELLLRLCRFEGNQDIVGHKELLSKVITSCLLHSSIDTNPQCKYNLLKCVDALTVKDPTKINQGRGTDVWLLTQERAALIYTKALERETSQKFDGDRNIQDRQNSKALQLHLIDRLYEMRANGAAPSLDAMARPDGDWAKYLPDVAKFARDTLGAMRHGVAHLMREAAPDKHSDLATRADFIKFGLQDSKFNYEGACLAMFRACKDKPIEHRSDSRAEELLGALNHENERVRLTAAIILADSKVDAHFMAAVDALAKLAVNGSHARYQADAQSILKDIISRGQPAEQDIAYRAWRQAFDQRQALPPGQQPQNIPPAVPPPAIPKPEELGTRKVPIAAMDLILRNGREELTRQERIDIVQQRITNLARMTRRPESEIIADITSPDALYGRGRGGGRLNLEEFLLETPEKKKNGDGKARVWLDFDEQAKWADAVASFTPPPPLEPVVTDADRRMALYMQKPMMCARHHDPPPEPKYDFSLLRSFGPKTDLESLEARAGIYPFAIEALKRGTPEAGRPVWGQVRHRETAALEQTKLETRNASLATDWLDQRLRTAEKPQDIIDALRDSCTRTPLTLPNDRRINRVMDMLKNRNTDEAVRMECAAIILRGSKENFVNKGFTDEQRGLAYDALNANAANLLKKGIEGKDAASLTLLDRAMEAGPGRSERSWNLAVDHVTARGANWAEANKLVLKHMPERYSYTVSEGVTRHARKIPEGVAIADHDAAGKILRAVTPDGVKYGDILTADLKVPGKSAPEKIAIARNLLSGIADIQATDANKQAALDALAAIAADSSSDSKSRMTAVSMLLAEKQATAAHQQNAMSGCIALSRGESPEKAEARALLPQFDKETALWAIPQLVGTIKGDITDAERRERLEILATLTEKWKAEPKAEAAVYEVFAAAQKLPDNAAIMQRLSGIVDRSRDNHGLSAITAKDDPRLKPMADVIASTNTEPMALSASLAFLDASNTGVTDAQRVEARKHMYKVVETKLADLRQKETGADPKSLLPEWDAVDKLLARLGAGAEDYSRLYIQSRRLEAQSDYKGLLPVYEKLAKLSADRGSEEGARIYSAKALEAKIKSGADPQLAAASKTYTDSLEAAKALRAKGTGGVAQQQADQKLEEAARAFNKAIGTNSEAGADALLKAAEYFRSAGDANTAASLTLEGTTILQNIARTRVAHLDPSIVRRRPTAGEDKSTVPVGKRLSTGNDYTSDDTDIKLDNDGILTDVLDYEISKTAVAEQATADAKRLATRALDQQIETFGDASPQAVQANAAYGDFLQTARLGIEATQYYERAVRGSEGNLNPATLNQHTQLVAKLAHQKMMTGGPGGYVDAVDMMEGTIKKLLDSNVSPDIVATQMHQMAAAFQNRDVNHAQDLMRRAETLRTTGKLPPAQTQNSHYSLYKGMAGGPGGPNGPAGGPGMGP